MELGHGDLRTIQRLLRGDGEAFDRFVDEYYPRLYRFAFRRMPGHAPDVQDVVQTTFATAIRKLAQYRGEAALFSWLCAFCRFEIAAFHRKHRLAASRVELVDDSPEVRGAIESLAIEDLDRREIADAVRVTLDHLPPRYDRALEWKYLRGLSVREIGEQLALSTKAAESLLTRAREAFRETFAVVAGRTL